MFAWITGGAAGPSIIANVIIGLVIFNYDDYVPKRWHTTLVMWAIILMTLVFNLWFRKFINAMELIGGICHFLFFLVAIITLAALAERNTPQFVFQNFTRGLSGWDNDGVTWGLGLLTISYAVNGFDGVLHMSEY
jgi:choline transport protein